ncbi:short neuropeptide F [Colletes latitarsis]|uniref:short neuropeptide F n=1 Tax=Colletes latitarsis TaxID=2605962 RepID=UPI004036922A
MWSKLYVKSMLLFVIIGFAVGVERYKDYGDEIPEKIPEENIQELYKFLMHRSTFDDTVFGKVPFEHLMIRKSQRSPSLRLRFGRSNSNLPMERFFGYMNGIASSRFNDN